MIKRCNPTYFLPIYIPFIFLAMQKVKIATLKMPGEYASTLVFSVPPNLLGMLLSETGGNKSAILSFMIDCLDKYKNLMGYDGLDVTDFTLEALRGAMADNDGSCLVHMHEGKKLCSLGQYKKGGDDSVEVLMEALDGVPMRIARKGGGGQEPAEEDGAEEEVAVEPSRRKQKTVTITTIQPHLNMSVLTHPQHQYRQSAAEEADPVGNVTRQSTGMMRAITYDAPDAKDVLSWMAKINEWPKLHIIL